MSMRLSAVATGLSEFSYSVRPRVVLGSSSSSGPSRRTVAAREMHGIRSESSVVACLSLGLARPFPLIHTTLTRLVPSLVSTTHVHALHTLSSVRIN